MLRRVIASELNEKFNPIHDRKWNLVATLVSKAEGQYQTLYFFCAVTGVRVSEAVAVEIDKHMETDCLIVYVRQQREKSVNRVKEHLKTESGCRDVDIHPDAAAILRNYVGSRKNGFLFRTANGSMLDPGNVARDSLRPILAKMGKGQVGHAGVAGPTL